MAISGGDVRRNLPTKGFRELRSGDHISFKFWFKGKETKFHTFVSHGSQKDTLGDDLLVAMRRQLGLQTMKQVRQLGDCTMDEASYIRALKDAGHTLT